MSLGPGERHTIVFLDGSIAYLSLVPLLLLLLPAPEEERGAKRGKPSWLHLGVKVVRQRKQNA